MAADHRAPPADTFRLDPERAAWREVGDAFVVLDLVSSSYLSVNETGATLWPLLEAGTGRDDMIAALLDEFDVDRSAAAADVDRFLDDLRNRGLLLGG